MKDFAKRASKNDNTGEKKSVFRSNSKSSQVVSSKVIFFVFSISLVLIATSFFYFRTDIKSIKPEITLNNVTIDFPTSLMENSILIESNENQELECEYFVQVGAYGNKKYALEAEKILESEIQNITINIVYSTLQPGKPLNSVISGPYANRSAANNAKEKITKKGFDPRLRTLCKKM